MPTRAASRTTAPRTSSTAALPAAMRRAAARRLEAGVGHAVAVDGDADAHEIAARGAAGGAVMAGHAAAADGVAQVLLEALVGHGPAECRPQLAGGAAPRQLLAGASRRRSRLGLSTLPPMSLTAWSISLAWA